MVVQERHLHRLLITLYPEKQGFLPYYQSISTLLASLVGEVKLGQEEWDYGHLWEKGAIFTAWKIIYSPKGKVKVKVKMKSPSHVRLFATAWTSSLPGSSLHGILQARVLAISFSRGSSQPRDQTWVSRIPGRRFNLWATREAEDSKFQNRKNTGMGKRKGWYNRLYYLSLESWVFKIILDWSKNYNSIWYGAQWI